MIQKLSAHGFAWEIVDNFTPSKIDTFVEKDKKECALEVNVEHCKATQEPQQAVIFSRENEHPEDERSSTKSLGQKDVRSAHQKPEWSMV